MDPLSITAGAIAFTGAISATLKTLSTIKNAKNELKRLDRCVSDLTLVLEAVQECLKQRQSPDSPSSSVVAGLTRVLTRAQAELQELDAILNAALRETSSEDRKIAKLVWLRSQSKAQSLQADLAKTQASLAALLEAQNSCDLFHLGLQLRDVDISFHEQRPQLSVQSPILEDSSRISPGDFKEKTDVRGTDPITTPPTDLAIQHANTSLESMLIERRLDIATSTEQPNKYSTVRIRASHYRRTPCEGWCACICHRPRSFQTPQAMENVIGLFSLGISGLSMWSCNEKTCKRQSCPLIKVSYRMPAWSFQRLIQFAFAFTKMNGLEIRCFSTPRLLNPDAQIFWVTSQGDINAIKDLFARGLASPFDVGAGDGWSLLHYAVAFKWRETTQFLLDVGAQPLLEDKSQSSPIAFAWDAILGKTVPPSTINAWRCIFDDEEHLESRMFWPLHKIVLGLNGADLRTHLEQSTAGIDNQDAQGRTALSWAAVRGDLESVKCLLEFKASCRIYCWQGKSPLQEAARANSEAHVPIVQALLEAGADPHHADQWGRTALHHACIHRDSPDCMEILLQYGVDVNARDHQGTTAIGIAVNHDNGQIVDYLISQGGESAVVNDFGYTPMLEAIHYNRYSVIKALLKHKRLSPYEKVQGWSALHIAAELADIETMGMLALEELHGFNLSDANDDGSTAPEIFEEREDLTPELITAFIELKAAVERCSNLPANTIDDLEDSTNENDNFVDAIDFIQ